MFISLCFNRLPINNQFDIKRVDNEAVPECKTAARGIALDVAAQASVSGIYSIPSALASLLCLVDRFSRILPHA